MRPARAAAWLLCASLLGACGASSPAPGYLSAFAEGQRALRAGRLGEAVAAFEVAHRRADRVKDRDEALFQQARALEEMGDLGRADRVYRAIEEATPRGPRAVHAAYDRARLRALGGDEDGRDARERALIVAHPESGLSVAALARVVDRRREAPERRLAVLEGLAPQLRGTALEQAVDVEKARALAAVGRSEEAIDLLLQTARAHPYPLGDRTDDALWEASLLEEQLGRHQRAIAHLREMLEPRERSQGGGSYERPRFPAAQLRLGTLLAERIGDAEAARAELLHLWDAFPDSTLRDDALWRAARLAHGAGQRDRACADVRRLARDLPESRFARCGHLLCEEVAEGDRPCASYVARELEGSPGEGEAESN